MDSTVTRKAMLLGLLLLTGGFAFASADYTPYEGNSVRKGTGGTKKVVDGVEIWNNGTPPRSYKILGILEDSRGSGLLSRVRFYPSLAEQAKKFGGDAILILNSESENRGAYIDGDLIVPLNKKTTKAEVIRYLDQPIGSVQGSTGPQVTPQMIAMDREQAAEGNLQSQYYLGIFLMGGVGVAKDTEEGKKWIKSSAERGFTLAQQYLSLMYNLGNGVPKDPIEGLAWGYLAAASGNADAQKNVASSEANLGSQAVALAKQRSKQLASTITSKIDR